MKGWAFLFLLLVSPQWARAGAWTQPEGQWQAITGFIFSQADRTYGSGAPIDFHKLLLQAYGEYGLRDTVTLFTTVESAAVSVRQDDAAPYRERDNAAEGGARLRLDPWLGLEDLGVLSLEASLRAAGAFNFAVSADRNTGGSGAQLRLLYGRGFKLLERDGFVDVEVGERLLSGARPNETPLDLTVGLWLSADDMALVQSFNLFAGAGRLAAYPAFESHKLQLSWVRRLSDRFRLQAGGFFSPAGRNALVEQGFCLSLWSRF